MNNILLPQNATPQRYLAIETSSPRLSLALGDDRQILARYNGTLDWRHADTLFDGMETLLKKKKWPIQSLTGVAVSVGPGSFTGIRIGLAAARALGQGLKIPVVGVSSLETMAAGAATKARWLVSQIDALRGQVFTALYERQAAGVRRIFVEGMEDPAVWIKKVKAHIGREPFWISPLQGCYPDASVLLERARPLFATRGPESYKSVLPLYIRQAAAVERKK